uniref:Uncharacterized protein HKRFX n=1 Tax=Human cytomegalovirus (strain AD169) TaxID=10360 RepID=J1I_HCMVA
PPLRGANSPGPSATPVPGPNTVPHTPRLRNTPASPAARTLENPRQAQRRNDTGKDRGTHRQRAETPSRSPVPTTNTVGRHAPAVRRQRRTQHAYGPQHSLEDPPRGPAPAVFWVCRGAAGWVCAGCVAGVCWVCRGCVGRVCQGVSRACAGCVVPGVSRACGGCAGGVWWRGVSAVCAASGCAASQERVCGLAAVISPAVPRAVVPRPRALLFVCPQGPMLPSPGNFLFSPGNHTDTDTRLLFAVRAARRFYSPSPSSAPHATSRRPHTQLQVSPPR